MQPDKSWRIVDENAPAEVKNADGYTIIEWDGKQYYRPTTPAEMQGNHTANS